MPDYSYKATDNAGFISKGVRFAGNPQELAAALKQNNMFMLNYRERKDIGFLNKLAEIQIGGVKRKDLVEFSRNMGVMLRSGVTLVNALGELRQDLDSKFMQKVIAKLIEDLQTGDSLQEAMKNQPKVFPDLYINAVAIGETTGNLDAIFFDLARHYKRIDDLVRNVRKAMIYPAFVLGALILASFIFLTIVFPPLFDLLKEFDVELPTVTIVVMAVSEFLQTQWPAMLVGIIALIILFILARRKEKTKYYIDWVEMNIPYLRSLMIQLRMAFFMRYMAMLLSAGVYILQGLQLATQSVNNLVIRRFMTQAREKVIEGEFFSDALRGSRYVPNMIVRMISIGEESGNLPEQMEQVADQYNEELERRIASALALLEPILLFLLAALALALVMGVLLPLYNLVSELSAQAGSGGMGGM
jgi:type II secretory pathway component PulF